MANKDNKNLRARIITNFEYIQSLSPSKLAQYFRTNLAHNQGCPPAPLMQVFTMCQERSSCDECWWGWLCAEHTEYAPAADKKILTRCWNCRWGAHGENAHPFVACMHKKFYGVIMDPEDYCSFFVELKNNGPKKPDVELALQLGELKEENRDKVAEEIRRRYELKQLAREQERRRREKQLAAEKDKPESPAPETE